MAGRNSEGFAALQGHIYAPGTSRQGNRLHRPPTNTSGPYVLSVSYLHSCGGVGAQRRMAGFRLSRHDAALGLPQHETGGLLLAQASKLTNSQFACIEIRLTKAKANLQAA